MTRQEFINEVNYWSDLLDFCREEGCYICDDIYDEYDRNERLDEDIVEMARNCSGWEDLRDTLNSMPTNYYYYSCASGDWEGVSEDDYEDYKNAVLGWMDENERWEDNDGDDGGDTEGIGEEWYEDELQAQSNVDANELEALLLK